MRKKKMEISKNTLEKLIDKAKQEEAACQACRVFFDPKEYYKLCFLSETAKKLDLAKQNEELRQMLKEREIDLWRIKIASLIKESDENYLKAKEEFEEFKKEMEEKTGKNLDRYGVDESTFEIIDLGV
jgi:hypothetical protein